MEGAVSQDARWAASLFEPRNRDRFDLTSGVPVSSASERRADRLDHGFAGDRSPRSRSFDAQPPGLWVAGSKPTTYQAKLAARDAKTAATDKKPGGKPPQPPTEGPLPSDQINLTDEDLRVMPVAGGGFEQCYNAQAAVAAGSLLVVAVDVVQAPNDKQQLAPMLGKIGTLPEGLDDPETLLADTGYFSAANVEACEKAGIEPLIAMGRQPHHPPLTERFETAPPAPENPTPVEAMAHRLKTPEGRKVYALRKQTPEPVFGIIKAVLLLDDDADERDLLDARRASRPARRRG